MIGIDTITASVEQFLAQAIIWAKQQPLLQDETKVVGLLYANTVTDIVEPFEEKAEIYYAAVTLDTEGKISRYLVDEPLKKIISELLTNMS